MAMKPNPNFQSPKRPRTRYVSTRCDDFPHHHHHVNDDIIGMAWHGIIIIIIIIIIIDVDNGFTPPPCAISRPPTRRNESRLLQIVAFSKLQGRTRFAID
jgi:hypothetical protein